MSYRQRSGSPPLNYRTLGTPCCAKAVYLLHNDSSSKAIGMVDNHIISVELEDALHMKREFKEEMYRLIDVLSK